MTGPTNSKKFQRAKEDFVCENCGFVVRGNGYTNHCPRCLWSKHVDINPGDRQEECGGLMEPIGIEVKRDEYILVHQCTRCGHKKKNKTSTDDSFDEMIKNSGKPFSD